MRKPLIPARVPAELEAQKVWQAYVFKHLYTLSLPYLYKNKAIQPPGWPKAIAM
jgi:hypothetical protein